MRRLDFDGMSCSHWKWPDIPGLHDFKGTLVHSANWPDNLDHNGKNVAVLGYGSSGVQIVPAIQPGMCRIDEFRLFC
jgi:cation diffusion facilitator CzcD-associated flavoprotein CzcO